MPQKRQENPDTTADPLGLGDVAPSGPALSAMGPFGGHFERAWPAIGEYFVKYWDGAAIKARLVTGWSVLFRLEDEPEWRLKTWCDSYQSHLWGYTDDRIVREMREAFSLGSREVAVERLEECEEAEESRCLQQPLRWAQERLVQVGDGTPSP